MTYGEKLKSPRRSRDKFTKKWDKIKQAAGLGEIEFHDLRRTFGSMQADAGVPIKALQEMYNHSNIDTTVKSIVKRRHGEVVIHYIAANTLYFLLCCLYSCIESSL